MKRENIIVAVVDGLGGGIGKSLVEKLKKNYPWLHIRALGTNSGATARMLKAGADDGATGENAVVVNAGKVQMILGVVTVLAANGLLGEVTPAMALAIGESEAVKILIPMERCRIRVAAEPGTVAQYLDRAVELAGQELDRLTQD
ncbi:DUF3842 family protein [uncultured Pseudoflavonifractor sp.]|uniref:DUF3842 family protein n=1 Tax=uncultured Pseudoflavonifractor sp. TaxID=1221379 RepID=UPI0025DCF112|nr:DUF3842 family protein [uncultured Pseudoflavonifractor sp.]